MARQVPVEAIFEALGQVKYPGYTSDIVTLGIVDTVEPMPEGGFAVTLRQASDRDELIRQLGEGIHQALTHDLGVKNVQLKVRRLEPELGAKTGRMRLDGTKHVIAVASGKGGVGKSTVAANLAVALAQLGLSVGLLDADIYGPSVPMMFGIGDERPRSAGGSHFYPVEKHGVKLISIGFFLGEKAPVIWRGPMVMGAVRQFLRDTLWGTQDFLIVDLPPGTGDAQLTLSQQVALDGVIIVTTPQDVALLDANRAVKMFRQVHCPLLGVVENMAYFVCPDCGERDELFGSGGGERLAREEGVEVLASIPILAELREGGDAGVPLPLLDPKHPVSQAFMELARKVAAAMPDERASAVA
ncbi:MAG TPA: Mrp/NBP35 family ATP-binding protein [Candidatus Binataceae bacterium]|nr:Mrp/NBP35 family ATP-binding protein [Candidatus Binataceae bacterium]